MSQILLQNRIQELKEQNQYHTNRILEIEALFIKNGSVMPSSVFYALRAELAEVKHRRNMNSKTIEGFEKHIII